MRHILVDLIVTLFVFDDIATVYVTVILVLQYDLLICLSMKYYKY